MGYPVGRAKHLSRSWAPGRAEKIHTGANLQVSIPKNRCTPPTLMHLVLELQNFPRPLACRISILGVLAWNATTLSKFHRASSELFPISQNIAKNMLGRLISGFALVTIILLYEKEKSPSLQPMCYSRLWAERLPGAQPPAGPPKLRNTQFSWSDSKNLYLFVSPKKMSITQNLF